MGNLELLSDSFGDEKTSILFSIPDVIVRLWHVYMVRHPLALN